MSDDEPTRRQIAVEIAIYAALVLGAGAVFVGLRVLREGTRVLDNNPRAGDDARWSGDAGETGRENR